MPHDVASSRDPLAQYSLPGRDALGRPVPLVSTRFVVRIVGGLAIVEAERTFRNAEANSIEATLTMPVPVHATLLGLKARINDRVLAGTAQRRDAARATYEEALDRGKKAVLHEEVLRGVHMISVGHLPPAAEIAVTGIWGMPMAAGADGTVTLRIPVTVGDVYGRSPLPDADDLVHGPTIHEADVEISCETGSVSLRGADLLDGRARVRLNAPIDIVVTGWRPQVLRGVAADGRPVTLRIKPDVGGDLALNTALLIDHSGSMAERAVGGRGEAAPSKHDLIRAGLRQIAGCLRPDDRIDAWEFANTATRVAAESFAAAVEQLAPPAGGTEMGGAIAAVLAGHPTRDVILVTDGKSHALDVQKFVGIGRRFHVVLIGEDSLEANVGYLAALTGGQLFISDGANTSEAIARALAAARAQNDPKPHITGAPAQVHARLGGMVLHATWCEGEGLTDTAEAEPTFDRAVAAVAAALAIPGMDKDAAAALAEAEGICCHLTSLVLVDEAGEVQEGIPAQRKISLTTPRSALRQDAMRVSSCETFLTDSVCASIPIFGALRPRSVSFPATSFRELQPVDLAASAIGQARFAADAYRIDWSTEPDRLRRGDLSGLPAQLADALLAASDAETVQALATSLGIKAIAAIIGLLAMRYAATDRNANRVATALLGKADPELLAAAVREVDF